jgi:hypothetical protein
MKTRMGGGGGWGGGQTVMTWQQPLVTHTWCAKELVTERDICRMRLLLGQDSRCCELRQRSEVGSSWEN